MKILPLALFALLGSTPGAFAAAIAFSSALATYDQGGNYDIAKSVNGNILDGLGWGVFDGQFVDETAVFATSAPFSASTIAVGMSQFFGFNHHIQNFRLSITSDPSPSLAGNWTQLAPSQVLVAGGPTAMIAAGNTVAVSGTSANLYGGLTGYRVVASGTFTDVTGVRLETFPNDYDPSDGLARLWVARRTAILC